MKFLHIKLSLLFILLSLSQNELYAKSAHDYADKVHKDIVQVIKSQQNLLDENPKEFTFLISQAFSPIVDFERISKNVMGRYYKDASSIQVKKFNEVFQLSLLKTYSRSLVEFQDERIIVLPELKPSTKEGRAKVYIEIITSTNTYPGMYSMYLDKNREWKIINIVINGVNLGITFRNQFYSLMKKNNNDIDKSISLWESSL
jgi:phospholipid transport system substrate-binding protein